MQREREKETCTDLRYPRRDRPGEMLEEDSNSIFKFAGGSQDDDDGGARR